MKITPLEIRQKEFEKVLRGYDKDEVKAFLGYLSQEWEKILDDHKVLKNRLDTSERELSKLRDLENSLFKTLKTAEDTGANLIEQARRETELQLKSSRVQSEELVNEAKSKAREIISHAEVLSGKVVDEMMDKIKKLENNYNQLMDLRDNYISQLRNIINDNAGRLEKLTKDLNHLEIQDIIQEAKKIYSADVMDKMQERRETNTPPREETTGPQTAIPQGPATASGTKSFFDEI
jgi:cell division initiation protein